MQSEPTPFYSRTAQFRSGTDTPRAFLERCLATIGAREPDVGAFVAIDAAAARAMAADSTVRWRNGTPLSAIDGMPIGIKDIIETADLPTQMGSALYDGWHSTRDAASVFALREAGAVVLGKTVTTEFAAPPPRGTRNPWDPARTPGGSSSGSAAAVAAGMLPVALGTQGIGSIIRPASYCGCVGFKPTIGAVNRGGSHDGLSQSAHGALAASLEDAWITLRQIVERIGGDPGFPGLYGPEEVPPSRQPRALAVLHTPGWSDAHPLAKEALGGALLRLRERGVTLLEPASDLGTAALEGDMAGALTCSLRINTWEMRWPLNSYRRTDASKISPFLLDRLSDAERMTLEDYRGLIVERDRVRGVWQDQAERVDAVVTLAAGGPAPVGLESSGNPVFAVPSSYLGAPSISLPLLTVDDLPVGLQLIGFQHRDADLMSVARWISEALTTVT